MGWTSDAASGRPGPRDRAWTLRRRPRGRRHAPPGSDAEPPRPRAHPLSRRECREANAGGRRGHHARGSRPDRAGAAHAAGPGHGHPRVSTAGGRYRSRSGRTGRGGGRRVVLYCGGRGRAHRRRLRAARRRCRSGRRPGGWSAAGGRGESRQPRARRCMAPRRSRPRLPRGGPPRDADRAAAAPVRRPARAPRGAGPLGRGYRRADGVDLDAGAVQDSLLARAHARARRSARSRDRSRRRRRIRGEGRPLPGRGPRRLARAPTRAAGEVGLDSGRGPAHHQPRPRWSLDGRARSRRRRTNHGASRPDSPAVRLKPRRHCRRHAPEPRPVPAGVLPRRTRRHRIGRRLHDDPAGRRLPGRGPARGRVPDRAPRGRGRAVSPARSGRAEATQPDPPGALPLQDRHGAGL